MSVKRYITRQMENFDPTDDGAWGTEVVLASEYDLAAARIAQLERVMKAIAMATDKGALYESIAIHNTAREALKDDK